MPTTPDMYDRERKKQLFVDQREIDAQARVYNTLTGDESDPLITTRGDNCVIVVHPSRQIEAGTLQGADAVNLSDRWNSLAAHAGGAGLIHMAYGGYMVLFHPEGQLTKGIYHKCQIATGNQHRLTPVGS